jgi:hypothetical protein
MCPYLDAHIALFLPLIPETKESAQIVPTGPYIFSPGRVHQLASFGWQALSFFSTIFALVDPLSIWSHGN